MPTKFEIELQGRAERAIRRDNIKKIDAMIKEAEDLLIVMPASTLDEGLVIEDDGTAAFAPITAGFEDDDAILIDVEVFDHPAFEGTKEGNVLLAEAFA